MECLDAASCSADLIRGDGEEGMPAGVQETAFGLGAGPGDLATRGGATNGTINSATATVNNNPTHAERRIRIDLLCTDLGMNGYC